MSNANHRVKEACMICEGSGRVSAAGAATASSKGALCSYCQGHGQVFARTGSPEQIMLATGDCKQPMRLQSAEGGAIHISRRNT